MEEIFRGKLFEADTEPCKRVIQPVALLRLKKTKQKMTLNGCLIVSRQLTQSFRARGGFDMRRSEGKKAKKATNDFQNATRTTFGLAVYMASGGCRNQTLARKK